MSLQVSTIDVSPFLPIKGIYYIGQYGTSGYATAARGYLYHYHTLGIPITWSPLYFDDSELDESDPYNIVVKSLIDKKVPNPDMFILHSTPDLWPSFISSRSNFINQSMLVGYCTWETNIVPSKWVDTINRTVHELWVPSNYNRDSFLHSGVHKTIRVVPHIYLPPTPIDRSKISLCDDNLYTFYTIGEMNVRKSILDVVRVFCKTFTSEDDVRLIVKTHHKDYSRKNRYECENQIMDVVDEFTDPPLVISILDNCSCRQISALHTIGDCYVSLSRSEGFGLPIFDAFNMGKKIIATGYGGHIDFLKEDYPGLVKYVMEEVHGMQGYSGFYDEDKKHFWAKADEKHASELMEEFYEGSL